MLRLYSALFSWVVFSVICSCSSVAPNIFGRQSFHDLYGKKLTDAGLKETALGQQWFAAAEAALQRPTSITIPYKEVGYFAAEKPRAVGLKFSVRRGQKLTIQLDKQSGAAFMLYADLWNAAAMPVLKTALDTAKQRLVFEAGDNSDYIIRLQPELLSSGAYTITIALDASLGFPVAGSNARIGSLWGDARDAGARRHEGIDIFAPKHTPAIAVADGIVTTVNENALGGKTVWLRPQNKDYVVYYAHLDSQLVQEQQHVRQGDTVGLVGNTGNARTTPSHLHFGVYAVGGAIDPLPFVNLNIKTPQEVDTQLFKTAIRFAATTTVQLGETKKVFRAQTFATALALNATTYRILFADGTEGMIPIKAAQNALQPLGKAILKDTTFLLEKPFTEAILKRHVYPLSDLGLVGYFNGFALVQTKDGEQGWVFEKVMK